MGMGMGSSDASKDKEASDEGAEGKEVINMSNLVYPMQ